VVCQAQHHQVRLLVLKIIIGRNAEYDSLGEQNALPGISILTTRAYQLGNKSRTKYVCPAEIHILYVCVIVSHIFTAAVEWRCARVVGRLILTSSTSLSQTLFQG
jgi:hypothetical protein